MTAEIAILNKTAVAMATDSAVTISAGQQEEKIFDSGDKLFELCEANPIGVMIYNNLQFAEIPLPNIIKDFRKTCPTFDNIRSAAQFFLDYLNRIGRKSSTRIQNRNLFSIVDPILNRMAEKVQSRLIREVTSATIQPTSESAKQLVARIVEEVLAATERLFESAKPGSFVGGPPSVAEPELGELRSYVFKAYPVFSSQVERIVALLTKVLLSEYMSPGFTGIVVAGFGEAEIFPTLAAYEIDGMVLGRLKWKETRFCDIDRDGERAAVIPFAQKEMVDRFLYGLDDDIEREITDFAEKSISTIKTAIIEDLEFSDAEDEAGFKNKVAAAEQEFLKSLKSKEFDAIREKSKRAIEDIVEFMPKPEIARMAEALIELTSIKRRVSRGMETVREPIDVAIISRGDGFVWIKRKHYFDAQLNPRYLERLARGQHRSSSYDNPARIRKASDGKRRFEKGKKSGRGSRKSRNSNPADSGADSRGA